MGSENSVLDDCELDEPVKLAETEWLFSTAIKKDGTCVSVFSLDKQDKKDSHAALKKAIKCLRRVRHPFVVSYIASGETYELGWCYVTEELIPLEQSINDLSAIEICAGLYSILQALVFLHDKVGVCHNNVCAASIFTDRAGNWKLGGLDFTCSFKDASKDFLERTRSTRCERSISPEEKQGHAEASVEGGKARDTYSLAVFVEELLDKLQDLGDLMKTFELCIQDECLHSDPRQRPEIQILLNDRLFRNDFLEIVCFLKDITLKSDEEKEEFFRLLVPRLQNLSCELVGKRLVHPLLSRFVLLEPTANKYMVSHLLTPQSEDTSGTDLSPILDRKTYKKYLIPELVKIFHVHDLHIRKLLLKHFSHFCKLFDEEILSDIIFPQVLLGLRDSDKELVSASLHALADIVLVLGTDVVIGGSSKKYFSEGNPKFGDVWTKNNGLPLKTKAIEDAMIGKKLLKDLAQMSVKGAGKRTEVDKNVEKKESKQSRKINHQRRKLGNTEKKETDIAGSDSQYAGENESVDLPEETDLTAISETADAELKDGDGTESDNSEYSQDSQHSSSSLPTNTDVLYETPAIDWSDVDWNTSQDTSSTHSMPKQGKLKLQHSNKSKSVIKTAIAADDVPKNRTDEGVGDHKCNDDSESHSRQNSTSVSQSEEFGLEFDIKHISVRKATSGLDFFADMVPEIKPSVTVSVVDSLQENTSKTRSTVNFSVQETEVETDGWGQENWDTEDF